MLGDTAPAVPAFPRRPACSPGRAPGHGVPGGDATSATAGPGAAGARRRSPTPRRPASGCDARARRCAPPPEPDAATPPPEPAPTAPGGRHHNRRRLRGYPLGAMPPPSSWERSAPSRRPLPPWGTLVLQGAARGWMIFAIVWGSILFVGQNISRTVEAHHRNDNGARDGERDARLLLRPSRRPVRHRRALRGDTDHGTPDPRTRGECMNGFDELVAEGAAAPVEGWDFSWFEGRATEERPPWGYARGMGERMAQRQAASTSRQVAGEVLATVGAAAGAPGGDRGWPPNVDGSPRATAAAGGAGGGGRGLARTALRRTSSFDLVVSRHPIVVLWARSPASCGPAGRTCRSRSGRDQPGADRLHDGAAAGQREPQRGRAPRPERSPPGSRWSISARPRCASSSSTSAPSCTSCARCRGRCRGSRPRPTPTRSAVCTSTSNGRAVHLHRPALLVEARRPA